MIKQIFEKVSKYVSDHRARQQKYQQIIDLFEKLSSKGDSENPVERCSARILNNISKNRPKRVYTAADLVTESGIGIDDFGYAKEALEQLVREQLLVEKKFTADMCGKSEVIGGVYRVNVPLWYW